MTRIPTKWSQDCKTFNFFILTCDGVFDWGLILTNEDIALRYSNTIHFDNIAIFGEI